MAEARARIIQKVKDDVAALEQRGITLDMLNNMTQRQLRFYTTKNRIIRGINKYTKADYLREIPLSKFWRDNVAVPDEEEEEVIVPPVAVPKKDYGVKVAGGVKIKPVKANNIKQPTMKENEILLLRKKLSECEEKIKDIEEGIKDKPKAEPKEDVKEEVKAPDMEDMVVNATQKIEDPKLEEVEDKHFYYGDDRPPKKGICKCPFGDYNRCKGNLPREEDFMMKYHDEERKKIDVGNTIVNVYCGGDKTAGVPQDVARYALQAQQLPLQEQQRVSDEIRQFVKAEDTPYQTPAPVQQNQPAPVQAPTPRPTSALPKAPIQPARKFEPVKMVVRNTPQPVAPSEPVEIKKSSFADDDEEEETEAEKTIRQRKEDIAREVGQSSNRGKSEKFKSKLEGLFAKPRPPPT